MHTALTIAGSDSGGGAGIQADLKTFAAHGVFGTSALTAITAQNTQQVTAVHVVPPAMVVEQIRAVVSDIRVDAVKTGMLANAGIISAIVEELAARALPHLVIDPVMVAKSGDHLLEPAAVEALRARLLPLGEVVTPNRLEAEVLADRPVRTLEEAREAARIIRGDTGLAVVVKGGHFAGPRLTNLLYDGLDYYEFVTTRVESRHTHGTGCTFASALAANLAIGYSLVESVDRATTYVAGAVANGLAIGHGHGPVDHFWRTRGTPGTGT